MRQIMMTVVFAALISIQVNAAAAAGNNDVAGKWKYEVPQAPYGYQQGVIFFTEKEGQLEGEVTFQDGNKVKLKNVSFKEDLLKFGLYIDYEYIKAEARVEGQGMKGMVDSSEGKMTFTAVAAGNHDIAGEWKYEVPQAPYGYQKGVISFTQTEGELEGEVRFQDGYKIKLKNVSYKEDLLKFGLYIDYEYIKVEARVEGQGMKGMVDSSEGKMTFTAGKVLPPPPENK